MGSSGVQRAVTDDVAEGMLIASDTDLMVFKNAYGIYDIKTEY